jgi:nucleoside-diphosphate-sugar epimerase
MTINEFHNKKVVVTGGSGFIGINLIRELHQSGAQVTSIDYQDPPRNSLPDGVKFIKSDLSELGNYQDALSICDYCFHLAARTDLNGNKIEDYAVNFEGTARLIEGLKSNKKIKRFVFYSTQLVAGIFNETRFIDEEEPYRTKTPYGESKIRGEKVVSEKCTSLNIPYTIIRPTSVYGPFGNEPYRDFFRMIKKGRYFHIGKADNLICMVFVGNLVDQTLFLAGHPNAENECYFGNDLYPYTMRQFADSAAGFWKQKLITMPDLIIYPAAYLLGLFKLIGFKVPLYPFRLTNIKANYCYSIQKSVRLGYSPEHTLAEGMKQTLSWYDENIFN